MTSPRRPGSLVSIFGPNPTLLVLCAGLVCWAVWPFLRSHLRSLPRAEYAVPEDQYIFDPLDIMTRDGSHDRRADVNEAAIQERSRTPRPRVAEPSHPRHYHSHEDNCAGRWDCWPERDHPSWDDDGGQ